MGFLMVKMGFLSLKMGFLTRKMGFLIQIARELSLILFKSQNSQKN
jgi:hypothetical protein